MNRTIVKFGGSNLKSTEDIEKIIAVVKSYKNPLIIVVSAFFGITDILNTVINQISEKKKTNFNLSVNDIKAKKIAVINKHIKNIYHKTEVLEIIEHKISNLKYLFFRLLNNPDSLELKDEILSYGERLSAFTISEVLKNYKISIEEALPENIGLISNNNYSNGSILLKKSSENLKNYFKEDINYVIPGFYGVSDIGKTVLLGRGGSDYSAAAIAYCTNAKSVDLWKDVDGYLSVDPKIINSGEKIAELTYLEAAELSYFGAKILHPRTIQPLIKKNIKINIFNINSIDKSHKKGTTINGFAYKGM